jgi:quercetin dioxygenase-like cupin family protein
MNYNKAAPGGEPLIIAPAVVALWGLAQPHPPPFPREGATRLIENERVVVWDVSWKKGVPTPMHEHRLDLTGVFLADGAVKITAPDGSVRMSESSPLGVVTYGGKGVVHSEEGVSDNPRRAILVELKDHPVPPLEPPPGVTRAFPRDGAKSLLDNERVSVWEYLWLPGQPVPLHFHDKDVVAVFVEAGQLKSTPLEGEPTLGRRVFGEVLFNPRGRAHSEETIEGTPRAIIIELKD